MAGTAVAALLVVLAAAAEGLTTPSGRTPSLPGAPLPTPTPTRPPTTLTPSAGGQALDVPGWLVAALVAVVVALVAVVVVLVVRRLLQRRASREEVLDPLDDATAASGAVLAAPVVRRGIARSLEVLQAPRDLDDAVVCAWLGLEEAAADAGVARAPAETPTEFTGRLLSRVPADREAVEVLRALYSRARFGARPGATSSRSVEQDDDDAERARAALRALARSWDAQRDEPLDEQGGAR
ncbi:DUF4129 domain-containing protein [Quadrisphaera setariae]|uniref:DUF4129 domain-containing protein n=1 Tax=Quadrisphaera setariae TaxID=2593304 RepID=A0A5C8ZG47_9ACTN|nr:DUF4129 domain-containing protein [Quadrisphaera setariae]TXR55790.1 DUF4129 domain-containing protein [Quadrisphaera setariae]